MAVSREQEQSEAAWNNFGARERVLWLIRYSKLMMR
jgi:hypothetical protein